MSKPKGQPGVPWQTDAGAATRGEDVLRTGLPAVRSDLQLTPQLYLGQTVYVVKDPVSLTYFRLKPIEYLVFRNLDGKHTAEQIAELVARTFPDQTIRPEEIMQFVQMLRMGGLLHGQSEQHGHLLRKMQQERRTKRRKAVAMNFLFIKIPLIDPDKMLDRLYGLLSPLMNRYLCWLTLAFMAISGLAASIGFYRVGELQFPILSFTNLALLSGTFFVIKVIHEFGHGLAAKVRALEVHEMGVLLMVFWPMFYVDVSDAWMLPRKRERMWITAGGVFIEFLFASIAVWVWLFTEPGLINQIAFNTMLAASVATFLFNANPLLRYDGYYFLMDWMEIPNLREKASKYLAYLAKRYLLQMPDQEPPEDAARRPIFMLLYTPAAAIYRWLVVFGIILIVWNVLDPYGLGALGALMAITAVFTMAVVPGFKLLKFAWSVQAATWRRLGLSAVGLAGLAGLTWAVLAFPLTQEVEQPAIVLAEHRAPVYAPLNGRIVEVLAETGQTLKAGDPILRLDGSDLRDDLDELQVRRKQAQLELKTARQKGKQNEVAALAIEVAQIDRQLAYTREKLDELTIRAPIAGRFHGQQRLETLPGRALERGQSLGMLVGDGPRHLVMILPQDEASQIRVGMPVDARFWAVPWRTSPGVVERIGSQFIQNLPHEALSSLVGGEVDTLPREGYNLAPDKPSVVLSIRLDNPEETLLADGMTGRGKVIVGTSSLGYQQWRKIRQALNLDIWLWF